MKRLQSSKCFECCSFSLSTRSLPSLSIYRYTFVFSLSSSTMTYFAWTYIYCFLLNSSEISYWRSFSSFSFAAILADILSSRDLYFNMILSSCSSFSSFILSSLWNSFVSLSSLKTSLSSCLSLANSFSRERQEEYFTVNRCSIGGGTWTFLGSFIDYFLSTLFFLFSRGWLEFLSLLNTTFTASFSGFLSLPSLPVRPLTILS